MPTVPIEDACPRVLENEDFLVYHVESDSYGNSPYRVDMQKFCGHGHCECPDFCLAKRSEFKGKTVTKLQAMQAGAIPSPAFECKHIKAVNRYLSFCVKNPLIQKRDSQTNENKTTAKARAVDARVHRPARQVDQAGQRPPSRTFAVGERTPFARQGRPQNSPQDHR